MPLKRLSRLDLVFLLLVQKANRLIFWWGKFRQTVETFMLSLIVLPVNLLRCRRNSRQYLHTFAFVSSYFLICNPHLEAIETFFPLFSYSHINFTTKMNTNVIKLNTFRGFLFSCVHYFSGQ